MIMPIRLPLVCVCLILPALPAKADFADSFNAALAQGHIAEAEALAETRLSAAPTDDQARFALGGRRNSLGRSMASGRGCTATV
jgi:hypothetical protein